MSTDLTREQACDKFIKQKMRDGAGGLNRMISRAAFEAGWSARDAEVAEQQITITQLRDTLAECLKCVPVFDGQAGNPLYAKVQKILKQTEPTK